MKQNTITALKKVIAEMVSKEVAKHIKYVVEEMKNPVVAQPSQKAATNNNPVEQVPRINVKDPILNKILNETQGGIPAEGEAYPVMGGGAYRTDNMPQIAGGVPAQPSDPNLPDFMKKAMSGHSAKVVKAIEKKHGAKAK